MTKDATVQEKLDEIEHRLQQKALSGASQRQKDAKQVQEKRLRQLVLEERSGPCFFSFLGELMFSLLMRNPVFFFELKNMY